MKAIAAAPVDFLPGAAAIVAAVFFAGFGGFGTRLLTAVILLANPLTVGFAAQGPATLFQIAAGFAFLAGLAALPRGAAHSAAHSAAMRAGGRFAFASIAFPPVSLLMPPAVLWTLVRSPWRGARRRVGYALAVWTPALLALAALAYLSWIQTA